MARTYSRRRAKYLDAFGECLYMIIFVLFCKLGIETAKSDEECSNAGERNIMFFQLVL